MRESTDEHSSVMKAVLLQRKGFVFKGVKNSVNKRLRFLPCFIVSYLAVSQVISKYIGCHGRKHSTGR